MIKYLLLGKQEYIGKTGSETISKRFVNQYNIFCDYKNENKIKNLIDENKKYKKLIFTYQETSNYSIKLNFISLKNINYVLFTRHLDIAKLTNSATNGFSIFNNMKCYNHFIPFIPNFNVIDKSNDICLGFNIRNGKNMDSFYYFIDWLKKYNGKINLYIMGSNIYNFSNIKCIEKLTYTNNNIEFFENITHFIFPQSTTFIDPFPHTLMEAIQCNKQIIAPKIGIKKFKDGVDDILQIINYHTDFSFNKELNNNFSFNFNKFYKKLLDNNFDNYLEVNKYKTFYDWCSNEL